MAETPVKLRREVEPPQRTHSGLGIMLVASAAMFFAIAGSAFILRARMMHCRAAQAVQVVPAPVLAPAAPPEAPAPPPAATPETCGQPQLITDGKGNVTEVRYDVCPSAEVKVVETPDGPAYATKIEDVELR